VLSAPHAVAGGGRRDRRSATCSEPRTGRRVRMRSRRGTRPPRS